MTAFIARDSIESVGFISTQADAALTNWTVKLSSEYISIPAGIYELGPSVKPQFPVPHRTVRLGFKRG